MTRWTKAVVINPTYKSYFGRTYRIDPTAFGGRSPNIECGHTTVVLEIAERDRPLTFCLSELVLIDEEGRPQLPDCARNSDRELVPAVAKLFQRLGIKGKSKKPKKQVEVTEDEEFEFKLPKRRRKDSM
jgi:hypothetical protein